MEANGDLPAVVRGCSSFTSPTHASGVFLIHRDEGSLPFVCQEPFVATRRSTFEELHPVKQLFLSKPKPFRWHNTPLSSCSSSLASSLFERTKSSLSSLGHVQRLPAGFRAGSQASKSKKRKNTQKRVCEVPVEGVSSDVWAWQKYGQKPIKCSPFPRGYPGSSNSEREIGLARVFKTRCNCTCELHL